MNSKRLVITECADPQTNTKSIWRKFVVKLWGSYEIVERCNNYSKPRKQTKRSHNVGEDGSDWSDLCKSWRSAEEAGLGEKINRSNNRVNPNLFP